MGSKNIIFSIAFLLMCSCAEPHFTTTLGTDTYLSSKPDLFTADGAELFCQKQGPDFHLIEIKSEDENEHAIEFIKQAAGENNAHWTAGTFDIETKKLEWNHTDTPFAYKNFAAGEPSEPSDSCIAIRSKTDQFKWEDRNCGDKLFALCEKFDDDDNSGSQIGVTLTLILTSFFFIIFNRV